MERISLHATLLLIGEGTTHETKILFPTCTLFDLTFGKWSSSTPGDRHRLPVRFVLGQCQTFFQALYFNANNLPRNSSCPTVWLPPPITTRTCFSSPDRKRNPSRVADPSHSMGVLSRPAYLQTCRQTSLSREGRGLFVPAFLHRYPCGTSRLAGTVHSCCGTARSYSHGATVSRDCASRRIMPFPTPIIGRWRP